MTLVAELNGWAAASAVRRIAVQPKLTPSFQASSGRGTTPSARPCGPTGRAGRRRAEGREQRREPEPASPRWRRQAIHAATGRRPRWRWRSGARRWRPPRAMPASEPSLVEQQQQAGADESQHQRPRCRLNESTKLPGNTRHQHHRPARAPARRRGAVRAGPARSTTTAPRTRLTASPAKTSPPGRTRSAARDEQRVGGEEGGAGLRVEERDVGGHGAGVAVADDLEVPEAVPRREDVEDRPRRWPAAVAAPRPPRRRRPARTSRDRT